MKKVLVYVSIGLTLLLFQNCTKFFNTFVLVEVAEAQNPGKVLFIGDSLTVGGPWGSGELCLNANFRNFGVGGEGTTEVLQRIDGILAENPKVIFLAIGINDLNWQHRRQQQDRDIFQYLNLELNSEPVQTENKYRTFSSRYRKLIQRIRQYDSSIKIVMVGVLPIDEQIYRQFSIRRLADQQDWDQSYIATNSHVQLMNRALKNIAGKHNVTFVDVYGPMKDFANRFKSRFGKSAYDYTGVHFLNHNDEGYSFSQKAHYVLLADLLRPHINSVPYVFDDSKSKKTGCR